MARLYANENFPLPVVEGLRQSGHHVITIQETGKTNAYPSLHGAFPSGQVFFLPGRKQTAGTVHVDTTSWTPGLTRFRQLHQSCEGGRR